MKKNLRLLCLGLAAATVTCGFAQDDMTSSLKNADMELGLKGWAFDGTDYMGRNKKNSASQGGFHGMNQGVQETWHSDANNPLGDSYVMQKVKKLPAGTYVFGAYIGAAKQTRNQAESNRDSISGVSLFANEAKVAVATDNPDLGNKYQWAHSAKFNVATTVSESGSLLVGLRMEETNANYVVWDNATLYYFGDMSEAAALDAMAQIDMEKVIAVADTLVDESKAIVMNVDTLKNLKAAIETAKNAKTTAATLWDDSEKLFWQMGLAYRSVTDYANLKNHIKSATYVKDSCVWSETGKDLFYGDLEDALEAAQTAYTEAELDRAALTTLRATLSRAVGWMRVDSFYTAQDDLRDFINTPDLFTGAPGKYSVSQQNQLKSLQTQLADTLAAIEAQDEEVARPQDLYPYVAKVYAAMEAVKSNPIPVDFTKMPIEIKSGEGGQIEGTIDNSAGLKEFVSPMYRFQNKVETFRITVKKAAGGNKYFCISELAFYDGNGAKIELAEENFKSEYDHNALNPEALDGTSFAGLIDGNTATYFHSAWKNIPSGDHYIEVTLPNGGYDAFSFTMISRPGQPHQFPGELLINTPTPKRDEMVVVLDEAKALDAYCGVDPGFFTGEEAPEVFAELAAAIAEADALVANNGAEADMPAAKDRLRQAINNYKALEGDKVYNVPVAGKVYRIVSGFPDFFGKQSVEKALTVHTDSIQTIWWKNVAANDLQQEFVFEPILDEDGEPYVEQNVVGTNEEGGDILEPIYCYNLKNVATGLYVDSAFVNNQVKLVETPTDTVRLKWLGRGQWNIKLKNGTFHCGDHNGGTPGGNNGAYGGTWGVGSGIVSWDGGLDGASAWFIREYPEMPLTVLVENGEYRSDCIHFDATDSLTLTADKACAFENLALYDLYGSPISFNVEVKGAVATVKTKSVVPACAFAFNNKEGVAEVTLNVIVPEVVVEEDSEMDALEAKLEAVLAIAPEQGTGVGQYADITEYTTAVEAAEAMIEAGAEDAEIKAMIAQLDSAVAHLVKPHMPEAGKYYFIVSGLAAFEQNLSYNVALYPKDMSLYWAQENELDSTRCWQFEPATMEDLIAVGATDSTAVAFYIKNLGTGEYIGEAPADEKGNKKSILVPMVSSKEAAIPYTITSLQQGSAVAIATVTDATNRIHGAGHGEGKNKSGSVVYWNSGLGSSSAWRIVETENDFVSLDAIDFTEIEPEAPVVKGVYDLFGRRLVAPTTPGIYIIDGRKKVVK